jgi:FixJ family two-component response regulator
MSASVTIVDDISIVDDDESTRESLSGLLRSVGFVVNAFASSEAFLDSDQLASTDCLILDVRMPGMGGIELHRHLLSMGCKIPVIFITAHGDDAMRRQAIASGAVDFLTKPFNEDAILNAIQTALKKN